MKVQHHMILSRMRFDFHTIVKRNEKWNKTKKKMAQKGRVYQAKTRPVFELKITGNRNMT